MKKTTDHTEDGANAEKTEESTVVCLSHIPHGFYEPQMTKYFSQFGVVKRLRLSRSKKSGRSKGYAFIEFEFPDVAKIVAETMNGYLTYQKIMKCRVIPTDRVHPKLFYGCKQKFRKPWHREASIKRVNSLLTAPADRIHTAQKRRVQLERRKNRKLEKLGIAFKCDTLDKEWENLKGSVPGVKSPKLKWKKKQKDSPTSPGSGKRKKHLTGRGDDETQSAKKSKSGHKKEEEPVLENYSSDEQESLLPLTKSQAKLSLKIEEEEESSDDLSSETSSILLAEPEEKVWTGKKTGPLSHKVKATSPVTKQKNKRELQLPTPKLVETVQKEKTPKSVKKTDKGRAKMPTSTGASVKKTPRKPKTPLKAVGSTKKEPKTPKSGKVKTPKSAKKSAKKL